MSLVASIIALAFVFFEIKDGPRNERVTVSRAQFMLLATIEAEALHRSFFDDLFGHQKLINGLGWALLFF